MRSSNINRRSNLDRTTGPVGAGLAALHQARNELPLSEQAYSKAIALKPGDLGLLLARASIHSQSKHWALAAQDYETAIKLNANNVWLQIELASLLVDAGKPEEAIRRLEETASAHLQNEQPELRLATIHLMLGDIAKYQATCKRLLDRFEKVENAATANNVAWACALGPNAVKDMGRAVRLAERAVQAQPENTDYRDTLGAVQFRAGNLDETVKVLE